jgi:ubiquinone/menaquinone biosynthesis C-methylase UbiE
MSGFKGTASYYARFRPPYPDELIERLAAAAGLDGTGRLLDLATGTGPLAVPLARHVAEVVAVDVEPEMLATLPAGIRTVLARAEDVDESWGTFRLVTIGRAFHWFDGPVVMERLTRVTRQVALVGDSHEHSEAQRSLLGIARELIGEPPGRDRPVVRYADALARSLFSDVLEIRVEAERTWTVEQLLGYAYSTSFASLQRLGERRAEFERRVRERLRPFYRERVPVDALLGRRKG